MEQNNFEKQVQQKLDELKIPPSDAVWENVEKRINKKERKRTLAFLIPLLAILLLSGAYWFLRHQNDTPSQQNNIAKNDNKDSIHNEDAAIKAPQNPSGTLADKDEKVNENTTKEETHTPSAIFSVKDNNVNTKKTNTHRISEKLIVKSKNSQKDNIALKNNESKKGVDTISKNDIALNNSVDPVEEKTRQDLRANSNKKDSQIIVQNNVEEKMAGDIDSSKIKSDSSSLKNNTAKISLHKKQKHPWKWGITISGGVSTLGKSPFGLDLNKADLASSDPVNNPGGSGAQYYYPSKITGSKAFIAGLIIQKNISKRINISTGVSYKYYSLSSKTGARMDPAIILNSYYSREGLYYSASNQVNDYRNTFHFLEIPVSVEFQINKSNKLPLNVNVGANISQLVASNALQYQPNTFVYFRDNAYFNKTQIGFNTGLSVTLFAQNKIPVSIGPYLYYGASGLASKGLYNKNHFSYAGLKANILF